MSMMHRLICAVFALALAGGFSARPAIAGSQYVIVASQPASDDFAAGRVLSPGETLVVPQGTVVTLLGDDGSINTIPGPAEVAITEEAVTTATPSASNDEANRSTLSKIAGLLSGERERAETLGVSRSLIEPPPPQGLGDPWTVSVHESAAGCIKNGELVLARRDGSNAINLALRIGGDEGARGIVWRQGEAKFAYDKQISPNDRELVIEADKDFAKVELHFMPDSIDLKNPVNVLGWMIENGCTRQAMALIHTLGGEAQ